jgi:hypothetical protein
MAIFLNGFTFVHTPPPSIQAATVRAALATAEERVRQLEAEANAAAHKVYLFYTHSPTPDSVSLKFSVCLIVPVSTPVPNPSSQLASHENTSSTMEADLVEAQNAVQRSAEELTAANVRERA